MLPLCKFYRYLIYRLYHFSDDMPVLKVVLTLSFIHYVQLLIIVTVIEELFPVKFSLDLSKNESILFNDNPQYSQMLLSLQLKKS
jgi:hypothetical protein